MNQNQNSTFFSFLDPFWNIIQSKSFWIAALPATLWIFAIAILGQFDSGKELLKKFDLNLGYWLLLISVVGILGLFAYFSKSLWSFFKENRPSLWVCIITLFIAAGATYGTANYIEARHRVQSDESVFQSTAQNMYYHFKSGSCDMGFFENGKLDCIANASNFKARGLSVIYQVGMIPFGTSLQWIFTFQLILYFLTLLAVTWAIWLWTKNEILTLGTLGFTAFSPTIMFQFRSGSVEPLYIFLSALSFILLYWASKSKYVGTRDHLKWVLLALTLGFFAQTRQETLFCLFAFLIPVFIFIKNQNQDSTQFQIKSQWFLGFFALALSPVLFTISSFQGYDFQGGSHAAHGNFVENLKINWDVMTKTWPWAEMVNPFLGIVSWTSLLGLIAFAIRAYFDMATRKIFFFVALYHLQSYMILENVSGDFTIEINQRYALVFLPTLAFLTAFLFKEFFECYAAWGYKAKERKLHPIAIRAISLFLIILSFSLVWRHRDALTQNVMYKNNHLATEEYEIRKWIKSQPGTEKALWIYSRPWHFIGYHQSSIHYDTWKQMTPEAQAQISQNYSGNILYVRGLDCWDVNTFHDKAIETRNSQPCNEMEQKFSMQLISSTSITGSYDLKIFKISATTPTPTALHELSNGARFLTEKPPLDFVQTWLQPVPNKSINGNPLRINGQTYAVGIGAHAYSKIRFIIPEGFTQFKTQFGVDDEEPGTDGVAFSISNQKQVLMPAVTLKNGQIQSIQVTVQAGDTLILQTDSVGTQIYDHADWIEPTLLP